MAAKDDVAEGKPPTPATRFYKQVSVCEADGAFGIELDGRSLRTPGRSHFAVPARALAEVAAAEWRGQGARIEPTTMPLNALTNTAFDHVATAAQAVRDEICSYAAGDLVCYRAVSPQGLVERQAEAWDPVLDWADKKLGARFVLAGGIMPVAQPRAGLDRVAGALTGMTPLPLAAVSVITTLTGSALLALCLAEGQLDGEVVWCAAHVEEDWQIAHWGHDEEAAARRARRKLEFDTAALVLHHC